MARRGRALRSTIVCVAVAGLIAGAPEAENPPRVERSAPRATVSLQLLWANLELDYGRPSARERSIFGQLVPWDRLWRLGADEATRFSTSAELELGTLRVPAGDYALFAIPHIHTWTLVVNSVAQQWGAWNAKPADDVGRIELVVEPLSAPVEVLTITLEASPDKEKEGVLRIAWERSQVTVPLRILGDPPPPPPPPGGSPPKPPAAHPRPH